MRVRWGIEIDRTAFDAFLPISAQCVIRNHFGFTGFNEMIFSTSTDVIKQSPLSIAVGQSVINRICKRLSSTGNTDDVFLASYIVYGQLKRMSFPYKPMKIAVVSVLNRQVAKSISQFIQNQFSEYIESIDGYELYELRSFSHEELDYVIMDGPEFIYNYDFPRFIGNRLSIGSQVDELWKSVFVHGCQIQGTVDALSKMMKVYDAFDVPDRNNCFKMLAYKYGKDEKNSDMIHSWFMQNEERFRQNNYSSILFLTMARKLTKRDVFDIYRLKNALPDGEILKIKYVVCCSIDFVDNPVLLLGVNDVMESITSDLGKIDDLIDCEPEQRNALLTEFITERLKNSV
ncbi:MAG: hypothetical protein LKF79_01720 [Solobacterium sp.]|jgi:hypothetical protein|nr:hypothetical protein [Solobacterium sp.]